jgi:hypothetical protein
MPDVPLSVTATLRQHPTQRRRDQQRRCLTFSRIRSRRYAAVSTLLSQPAFANAAAAPRTAIAGSEADDTLIEALEDLANRTRRRAAA